MTVAITSTFQVSPANVREFLSLAPDVKRMHLELGASAYRGFRVRVGAASGAFIAVAEFESHEALGRFLDTASSNAEYSGLVAKGAGLADGITQSILDELDLG